MLNKHFREFLELLIDNAIRFVVVGGYAVGVHGFPRYTGDMDVFVGVDADSAARLKRVFRLFGLGDLGLYANRIDVDLDGLRVPFLGFEDLLKNKRASARSRDLIDVEELERIKQTKPSG